jgi:hypothetical protein
MFALTSGLMTGLRHVSKFSNKINKRHISFTNVHPIKDFAMNNQQIEYGSYPSCVDCMYFNASHSYIERGICLKYGTKNVVTGVVSYEEAKLHRGHNSLTCSIEGDGFAKKEPAEYNGCP